jgi:hypothetical protein
MSESESSMAIPRYFCWTRFGTEAAQTIDQIISRKEEERRAANGIFLWGIGNSVGRSISALLAVSTDPRVLFSPIKSSPRLRDVCPPAVAAWTDALGLDGTPFDLPDLALVTSRYDPAAPRNAHYALVCYSDTPLRIETQHKAISFAALKNISTGRALGYSQVTAVVEYEPGLSLKAEECTLSAEYEIAIEARLVPPFFIRLRDPIPLEKNGTESDFDFATARAEIRKKRTGADGLQQLALSL